MPAALALSGLLVVEIGTSVAGPFAGQILADLGAEVVKVENPQGGDDARNWGPPFVRGAAPIFNAVNRNKRSAAIDLKDEAQRAALRRFILDEADIVVQNLRPGLLESFGLDAATLARRAPVADLLQSRGLRRRRPAQGPARLRSADAGVRRPHEPHRRGRPRARAHRAVDHRPGQRHVGGDRDPVGAVPARGHRARAAWSAPRSTRRRSPGPTMHAANYLASGRVPGRMGSENFGICPYKAYQARDGWVVVAAGNNNLFQRLADALGHPEWPARCALQDQSRPRHQPRRIESAGRRGDRKRHGRGLGREVRRAPACPARRCSISSR